MQKAFISTVIHLFVGLLLNKLINLTGWVTGYQVAMMYWLALLFCALTVSNYYKNSLLSVLTVIESIKSEGKSDK